MQRYLPLLLLSFCASVTAAEPARGQAEFLNSPEAEQQNYPFSDAVRAGDLVFLSGRIGTDRATGRVVPGGIKAESRAALKQMQEVLERHGMSLKNVVKCTVFLADIAEWPTFNEVYREFFSKPYPARSALAASGLALDARVEVECIAYAPRAAAKGSGR